MILYSGPSSGEPETLSNRKPGEVSGRSKPVFHFCLVLLGFDCQSGLGKLVGFLCLALDPLFGIVLGRVS